jgi:hypothetical protein
MLEIVMPGLVPGIHVPEQKQDVDGRDDPGHDEFPVMTIFVSHS